MQAHPVSLCFGTFVNLTDWFCLTASPRSHSQTNDFRLSFPNRYKFTKTKSSAARSAEVMAIREVAEYLKVNEAAIHRLTSAQKLPAFKVGGSWRFSRADSTTG